MGPEFEKGDGRLRPSLQQRLPGAEGPPEGCSTAPRHLPAVLFPAPLRARALLDANRPNRARSTNPAEKMRGFNCLLLVIESGALSLSTNSAPSRVCPAARAALSPLPPAVLLPRLRPAPSLLGRSPLRVLAPPMVCMKRADLPSEEEISAVLWLGGAGGGFVWGKLFGGSLLFGVLVRLHPRCHSLTASPSPPLPDRPPVCLRAHGRRVRWRRGRWRTRTQRRARTCVRRDG